MSKRTNEVMKQATKLGIIALICTTSPAQAAECPERAEDYSDARTLVNCINSLKQQVVPSGAVMAFGVPCNQIDEWSSFSDATGRMIIGAGQGTGLKFRPFGKSGGEEKHTLTIAEMPVHTHSRPKAIGIGQGIGGTGGAWRSGFEDRTTGTAGRGSAHNNMPPYIALYFCKKD